MKIQKLKFSNNRQNWHIEEVNFDSLNLLVGASGVGKTRILSAIALICNVANDKKLKQGDTYRDYLDAFEWSINFTHLGQEYSWELRSDYFSSQDVGNESEQFEIVSEKLIQYGNNSENVIFHRTNEGSKLNGNDLPKLKKTESIINILSEEDLIFPVHKAFKYLIFCISNQREVPIISDNFASYLHDSGTKLNATDFINTPTVIKAIYLQKSNSDRFNEFKENYKDIFPSVEDLRITFNRDSLGDSELFFEIQENSAWIPQQLMSSGMFHTLTFMIEVLTAPEESVILIDEFENGLGINCMPQLAEFILDQPPSLQFILTSHHPYIIGHLPWQNWQIVSKSGSNIKVRKSTDIPALDTASSLDKFTQLINFLDYEESSK